MSKNCHRARKFQGLYVFNTKSSPARWVKGGGEGEGGEEKKRKREQFKKREKQKMMIKCFFSEFSFKATGLPV